MLTLLLSLAVAADPLNFAPDRPGVADSTGTPGPWHWMVEAGAAWRPTVGTVSTSAVTGRLGLGKIAEARLTLPDFTLGESVTSIGSAGVGAKIAGKLDERFGLGVVPMLWIGLSDGIGPIGGGARVSADATFDPVSLWVVGDFTYFGGASAFAGGGVSIPIQSAGLYANGGYGFGVGPLVGLGAWIGAGRGAQIDVGCDVSFTADGVVPVLMLGTSLGK